MAALAIGQSFEFGWLVSYRSPWLPLAGAESHAFSLVLGAAFAAAVVVGTRVLVENVGWAKNLHRDLRPMTLRLDGAGIAVIAGLSALAEELVFRGLLMPWLGLVPQALLFGVVHAQLSGPSRWVWVAWASVVGLALGAIFALSGSLLGAMLAHALINGLNLLYLRSHDTAPPRNSLGGLLSDRRSPVPDARDSWSRSPSDRAMRPAGRRA
jgi:membrane protease YdiL (CAAX protease family)